MIDTNKLREFAVKIGTDYPLVSNYMEDSAQEIERLRDKNSALQQELDECGMLEKTLRELVERYENALEWVSMSKNHMKKSEGDSREMFESWHAKLLRVGALSATHLNKRFADTPPAAIEAAMKEKHIENPPLAAPEAPQVFAQQVRQITDQLAEMLIAKNKAYGNSALDPVRVFSHADTVEQIKVRIDDKLSRLQRGHDLNEDTIQDLIGYLILLRIAQQS